MSTLAEIEMVVDKRLAWRVLFKVAITIISGCTGFVIVAFGPVLWVYGNVDGNRKDVARLEAQVNGLTSTVGALQLTVASVIAEVKATRTDQARDLSDIKDMLKAQQRPQPAPPARTANVPTRRTQ